MVVWLLLFFLFGYIWDMVNFGSDMLILLGGKFGVIFEGEDYLRREKCEG